MDEQTTTADDPPPRSPAGTPVGGVVEVDVVDATGRLSRALCRDLCARLERAVRTLGAAGEVRARVVGDSEMASLHGRHLGDATTTDVLTFDLREGGGGGAGGAGGEASGAGPLDVDLVLCLDEAERQARERGHGAGEELVLYALHGVLHCLGHDDHDEQDAARMHAEEDRVLRAIGVGAVYARSEGVDAGGAS